MRQLYKLGQVADEENQKVVMPLPPPGAPPQQQQQGQQQPQADQSDPQIIQFINQNRNSLPTIVKNALTNSTQRAIIVALVESLSQPDNHDFMMRFINFTKGLASKNQFRNSPTM